MKVIYLYLIIINLVGFITMAHDKKRAINKKWRIPEKNLFLIAIIGGSLGGVLGMKMFHHKTKHWQFKYGFPIILIIQTAIVYYLFFNK